MLLTAKTIMAPTKVVRCVLLGAAYFIFTAAARCAVINSNGTGGGNWSNPASWSPAQIPTGYDAVTINVGDTITVDVTTATASTTTINGTLRSGRLGNNTLTICGGNVTVNGTLDMGTTASPLPASLDGTIVLASGTFSGQFGLTVGTGGNLTMVGAVKSPYALAGASITGARTSVLLPAASAQGWAVADTIVIGPTTTDPWNADSPEQRVIASISGVDPLTISWAGGLSADRILRSTTPIAVINLTRNSIIRSSGSIDNATSAYLRTLTQSATSFYIQYGELAGLGRIYNFGGAPVLITTSAVIMDGPNVQGSISSSSVHNGGAFVFNQASGISFTDNVVFLSTAAGVVLLQSSNNDVLRNHIVASNQAGILFSSSFGLNQYNRVEDNFIYSNSAAGISVDAVLGTYFSGNWIFSNQDLGGSGGGIFIDAGNNSTIVKNHLYSNAFGGIGIYDIPSVGHVLANNEAYNNGGSDVLIESFNGASSTITVVSDAYYGPGGNPSFHLIDNGSTLLADVRLGYDPSGNSLPTVTPELQIGHALGQRDLVTCKRCRVNPATGISASVFSAAGDAFVSYGQDLDTGSVRVWGDYSLANSTLTLDYNTLSFVSTTTVPQLKRGVGHSLTVCSTADNAAVSQLITVRRISGVWQVSGSSTGAMGAVTPGGSCPGTGFPSGAVQINIVLTQGPSPKDGDTLDVALIAASNDSGLRKKMLFGPSASGFNGGKSRFQVGSGGGLVLRGASGFPTTVDMLPGGTYYTLVDSGAFTASFSSITNVDSGGVQLSGSAGVSIGDTGFDFMGIAAATNSYITARNLTSAATLTNVSFGTSRSTAATHAYNILVAGTDTGLAWTINAPSLGPLWGQPFDFDPNARISWGASNIPPSSPVVSQVYLSSIAVSYGLVGGNAYMVEASTASNFSGSIFRSSTTNTTINSLSDSGLTQNTTYFLRAGALWGSTTFYAATTPSSAVTLAAAPGALVFSGVTVNSFVVGWSTSNNPSGTVYAVSVSTDLNFGILTSSLTTVSATVTFAGLGQNTAYYVHVHAVNSAGIATADSIGVVVTTPGSVITISADKSTNVWYSGGSATFFVQGPGVAKFYYRLDSSTGGTVTTADSLSTGLNITLPPAQGLNFFHVLGIDVSNNPVQSTVHFGPVSIDNGSPTIAALSAQNSPSDPTPIVDGGTTLSNTPRFTWSNAVALAPVGYSISISTNSGDVPTGQIVTFAPFYDTTLTLQGKYYVKVSAVTVTLPTSTVGPPKQMSFTFTNIPATNIILVKKNYFNPAQGQCMTLNIEAATPGHVKAEVYTLLGQKVTSLTNQDITSGNYNYTWCGRNDSGEMVANGGYVLHVEAPSQKRDVKVAVVK